MEVKMILYPNMLLDSVTEITPEILYKNQINGCKKLGKANEIK